MHKVDAMHMSQPGSGSASGLSISTHSCHLLADALRSSSRLAYSSMVCIHSTISPKKRLATHLKLAMHIGACCKLKL